MFLETDFLEAVLEKEIKFGARKRPGRAIRWLLRLAAKANEQEDATRCNTVSNGRDGSSMQIWRKRLDRQGIIHEVKGLPKAP
jgi:hypothetical protein